MSNGGPAFPVTETVMNNMKFAPTNAGMTLRDYFAAAALPAILARVPAGTRPSAHGRTIQDEVADAAYAQADAMLKASGK